MIAIGALLQISRAPAEPPEGFIGSKHKVDAEVVYVTENPLTTTYTVKVESVDGISVKPFSMQATVGSVSGILDPGTKVTFSATPQSVEHDEEVPHEVDYARYLRAEGITARCYVNGIMRATAAPGAGARRVNSIRSGIYNAIVDSPITGAAASFLVASLLGDRHLLSADDYASFRDVGVAHVLALSGLHVGIIASMVEFLLWPMHLSRRTRSLRTVLTVVIVWGYAIITGFTPSIVRAAVMISVFAAARLIGRRNWSLNSLLLSVVVILCINPGWLFTPGFQLSVSAVASLLLFASLIPLKLQRHRVLYFIVNLFVVPVAAMLGTAVVSAYYFNVFPLMFVVGNVVAGLLFPLILGGGLVLAAFSAIGVSFALLGHIVDWLYWLMQSCITKIATIEGAAITDIEISAWVILPYFLTVLLIAYAARQKRPWPWILSAAMAVATVITGIATRERLPSAELYIPTGVKPTSIIMRTGQEAWLYTPAQRKEVRAQTLETCNTRYRQFLISRRCGTAFRSVADSASNHTYQVAHGMVIAADRIMVVVDSEWKKSGKRMPRRTDYALILDSYHGSAPEARASAMADTLLIGTDVHPSRRRKLIRQCADSIPYIDLKHTPLRIVDK